jgi:hypothetical protein
MLEHAEQPKHTGAPPPSRPDVDHARGYDCRIHPSVSSIIVAFWS